MPQIPTFEANVSPVTGPLTARADPAALGAPGRALARGAAELGADAGEWGSRYAQARRVNDAANLQADTLRQLSDAEFRWSKTPDSMAAQAGFDEEAAALKKKTLATLQDPGVAALYQRHFDETSIIKSIQTRHAAFKLESSAAVGRLDQNLDDLAHQAASAGSDLDRANAIDTATTNIEAARAGGWIAPEDAVKRRLGFKSRMDEVAARQLMTEDPDRAVEILADPKALPNLDEKRRAELYDTSIRRSIALENRRQRESDKALKEASESAAKELYAMDADGTLTRQAVEQRRRVLTPPEYNGFLKSLQPDTSKQQDDPGAVAELEPRLDREDVAGDVTREYRAGRLSTPTYRSMMERNRAVLKDDQPASPYKAGRELVNTTLDPGLLSGAGEVVLRSARAQALVEYDNWAAANLKAPRGQHIEQAQDIIRRYQTIAFDKMTAATGLPRFYSGTRQDMKPADIDAAEAQALQAHDAGTLTRDQLDQELRKTETWRAALQRKPAPAGAKK